MPRRISPGIATSPGCRPEIAASVPRSRCLPGVRGRAGHLPREQESANPLLIQRRSGQSTYRGPNDRNSEHRRSVREPVVAIAEARLHCEPSGRLAGWAESSGSSRARRDEASVVRITTHEDAPASSVPRERSPSRLALPTLAIMPLVESLP